MLGANERTIWGVGRSGSGCLAGCTKIEAGSWLPAKWMCATRCICAGAWIACCIPRHGTFRSAEDHRGWPTTRTLWTADRTDVMRNAIRRRVVGLVRLWRCDVFNNHLKRSRSEVRRSPRNTHHVIISNFSWLPGGEDRRKDGGKDVGLVALKMHRVAGQLLCNDPVQSVEKRAHGLRFSDKMTGSYFVRGFWISQLVDCVGRLARAIRLFW